MSKLKMTLFLKHTAHRQSQIQSLLVQIVCVWECFKWIVYFEEQLTICDVIEWEWVRRGFDLRMHLPWNQSIGPVSINWYSLYIRINVILLRDQIYDFIACEWFEKTDE